MREERCIRQSVLIVERIVKSHSSPMAANLYTAESVTRREDHQEEADFRSSQQLQSEIGFLPVSIFFFQIT
jgi:hypothetical protein